MFSLLVMITGQAPFNLNFRTEAAALKANETLHEDRSFAMRKIEDHYGQTLYFIPGGLVGTMVQDVELVMKSQMDLAKLQNDVQRKSRGSLAMPQGGIINLGPRN